jgi:hypothetical protein
MSVTHLPAGGVAVLVVDGPEDAGERAEDAVNRVPEEVRVLDEGGADGGVR